MARRLQFADQQLLPRNPQLPFDDMPPGEFQVFTLVLHLGSALAAL